MSNKNVPILKISHTCSNDNIANEFKNYFIDSMKDLKSILNVNPNCKLAPTC